MKATPEDKRLFVRHRAMGRVQYRILGEGDFHEGWLDNISANGVLFRGRQPLEPGARVLLVVEAEEAEQLPIEIMATVVRIDPERIDSRIGYGCRIEGTKNVNGTSVQLDFE